MQYAAVNNISTDTENHSELLSPESPLTVKPKTCGQCITSRAVPVCLKRFAISFTMLIQTQTARSSFY